MSENDERGATTAVVPMEQLRRLRQQSVHRVTVAVMMCLAMVGLVVGVVTWTKPLARAAMPYGAYRSTTARNTLIVSRIPRSFEIIAIMDDSTAYVRDPSRNNCFRAWLNTTWQSYTITYEHVPCVP